MNPQLVRKSATESSTESSDSILPSANSFSMLRTKLGSDLAIHLWTSSVISPTRLRVNMMCTPFGKLVSKFIQPDFILSESSVRPHRRISGGSLSEPPNRSVCYHENYSRTLPVPPHSEHF